MHHALQNLNYLLFSGTSCISYLNKFTYEKKQNTQKKILDQFFYYKITFVDFQHAQTNLKKDCLKKWV